MSISDDRTGPDEPAFDPRTRESVLAATASHPGSLAAMLVALGGSIADEDDLVVLLQRVVDVAHEVIDGADRATITIDLGGRTYTAAHTDSRTLTIEPAVEEGILSFLAAPLSASGQPLGALNLYGTAADAFDTVDADVVALLTTTVSRAIADFARFRSAVEVADALRAALENRAPIEQAKGIIMADHRVDADQAFALLRSRSQNSNRRVRDIAADLIASRTREAP